MAPFILFLPLLLQQLFTGNSGELVARGLERYPLKSGVMHSTISGASVSGTQQLQFDRQGWRYMRHLKLTMTRYGVVSKKETLTLADGDYVYTINLKDSSGKKENQRKLSALLGYKASRDEAFETWMKSQGATKIAMDTVLNQPCEVWRFDRGITREMVTWKGLPLVEKKQLPGYSYEIVVSKIDSLSSDSDWFKFPEGISWK